MKTKIGVLGSCITRDAFNSQIVHNYKDFFKIEISGQRNSIISILQDPIQFDENSIQILPINVANKAATLAISDDLNKKFIRDLMNKKIDYLIIDNFYDATMGILYFNNNQIISDHYDFPKIKFYENMTDRFSLNFYRYPDEYFCIWSRYCDLFFKFLDVYCPNVKVVLNKGRLIDKVQRSDKTIYVKPEYTQNAKLNNSYLDKLDSYIEKNFCVDIIEFDYEATVLNENHMWGLRPMHYHDEFYYNLIEELKIIVKNDKKRTYKCGNEEDRNHFQKELKRVNFETKLLLKNVKKQNVADNLNIYNTGRVDVKNFGLKDNKITVIESNTPFSENNFPGWFKTAEGEGFVISNNLSPIELKFQCINDGILRIFLRGPDIRDKKGNRFPVYIDFTNFRVNDKFIFNENKLIWHDAPYIFEKEVKDSEIINIYVDWSPFSYLSLYEK